MDQRKNLISVIAVFLSAGFSPPHHALASSAFSASTTSGSVGGEDVSAFDQTTKRTSWPEAPMTLASVFRTHGFDVKHPVGRRFSIAMPPVLLDLGLPQPGSDVFWVNRIEILCHLSS